MKRWMFVVLLVEMLVIGGGWGCAIGLPTEETGESIKNTPKEQNNSVALASSTNDQQTCTPRTSPSTSAVLVKGGQFQMGSLEHDDEKQADENPSHLVKITRDFWIDKIEVTQQEFKTLMGYNPAHFISCGANCPVENVSWHEALAYANARSRRERLPPCFRCVGEGKHVTCSLKEEYPTLYQCIGWRLPTEAEWEYAAKAGKTTTRSEKWADVAWFSENAEEKTHLAGSKRANKWGLYDMAGNVWEWVYDGKGSYQDTSTENPVNSQTGMERIIRGGSWYNESRFLRATNRYSAVSDSRGYDLGFRLVRSGCR